MHRAVPNNTPQVTNERHTAFFRQQRYSTGTSHCWAIVYYIVLKTKCRKRARKVQQGCLTSCAAPRSGREMRTLLLSYSTAPEIVCATMSGSIVALSRSPCHDILMTYLLVRKTTSKNIDNGAP